MIQRIQTLYLLVSALFIGLLFALPFAEIAKDGAIKENGLAVSVLIGIVLVLQGVAIFSFKKRPRQIRIVMIAILATLCLLGAFLYVTYFSFSGAQISFKIGMVFPLIAIILDYLAIRAIRKDEALIRSIDRIR
jgi:CDP-diglyceride synthetase